MSALTGDTCDKVRIKILSPEMPSHELEMATNREKFNLLTFGDHTTRCLIFIRLSHNYLPINSEFERTIAVIVAVSCYDIPPT